MSLSKKIFAYQHNIEKYRRDTGDLSLQQHGAYRTLMDEFYLTGGLLPGDKRKLYRIACCQNISERRTVDYIVNRFYHDRGDGYLTQNFAEIEMERISKVSEENSKNAKAKWAKSNTCKDQAHNERICDRNANHEPITNIHNPKGLCSGEARTEEPKLFDDQPGEKKDVKLKRTAAHELPTDFVPDAEAVKLCSQLGVDLGQALDELRDWAKAKRPRYADWQATFRNSIRRIGRYRSGGKGGSTGYGREPRGVVAAALRVADRLEGKG